MRRFDYFVILADMRTGSNFLEANLNALDGITCYGEAFNPAFLGHPDKTDILGITLDQREAEPTKLIEAIKADDGLSGFRLFRDHDHRVLDICLADPRCAKIILTRNPVDSFVSWQIAKTTGQWKLTNPTHSRSGKIRFDIEVFREYLAGQQVFQTQVQTTLRRSGQVAFQLHYDDLQDVEVINGIARYLECDATLKNLNKKLKKQNPEALADKVENFAEMQQELTQLDQFNLHRVPFFEPSRGPGIPHYVAAPKTGLLYMPIRSGPDRVISDWLAAVDNAERSALQKGFSQATLREWMAENTGFRSFTVLRHPAVRAHKAFCRHVVFDGPGIFPQIRRALRKVHQVAIPEEPVRMGDLGSYDIAAHRAGFLGFLQFLQSNLSAQTSTRIDPAWASQLSLLQGMAQFSMPDMVLREDRLANDLPLLLQQINALDAPDMPKDKDPHSDLFNEIYDADVEAASRAAYTRDYLTFGFDDWR